MKTITRKLLLSVTITMACCSYAQEIPTLAQLRPAFEQKKKYLAQKHPDEAEKLNDVTFLVQSLYSNVPEDIVKKALNQWYQEEPDIFNTSLISGNLTGGVPVGIADVFAIMLRTRDFLSNKVPVGLVDNRTMDLNRLNTVIDTLRQLGVKQTLSDEQIDNFARLEADELHKAYKTFVEQASGGMETVEEL